MSRNEPIDWLLPSPGVVVKLRSAKSINVLSKEGVSCNTACSLAVSTAIAF